MAMFIKYFMLFTRNKHLPSELDNEKYPRFLEVAFGRSIMKAKEVRDLLFSNDLDKMDKT